VEEVGFVGPARWPVGLPAVLGLYGDETFDLSSDSDSAFVLTFHGTLRLCT